MLLVVGLLVLVPAGGCAIPFLVLILQHFWLRGFDLGNLSGADGALMDFSSSWCSSGLG